MQLKKINHTFFLFLILNLMRCQDIEKPNLFLSLALNNGTGKIGIVSSDLGGAGHFSTMTYDGIASLSYMSIHSDAVARYANNRIYVVNRQGRDNILVLDPDNLYLPELEFSTEVGSNPQDFIRLNDNQAYITRYNRNTILIAHPQNGLITGQIDLSAYADADGNTEMSAMHLENNRLYVAIQRLDRNHPVLTLPPAGNSALIEIDTNTNTISAEHILPSTNPIGKMQRVSLNGQAHLIISAPARIGVNHALDGGVVAFNLETNSFHPGLIYNEITAGGDIMTTAIKNDQTAFALVMFADYSMALQGFDPATGAQTGTLAYYPVSGGFVSDMLLAQNGLLYVASATYSQSGITIYDTNAGNQPLSPTPIDVGLRPTGLIEIP